MPWKMEDALAHTTKARTAKAKKAWAGAANSVLGRTGDEGKAIRIANSVAKKLKSPKTSKPRKAK